MKKLFAILLLFGTFLSVLSACGTESGANADLVFVNDSDAVIVEVVVDFEDQSEGARRADSCPLNRGETFGFETGQYPVTVAVYDASLERSDQKQLASLTIPEAPSDGERWYVTAQDGENGLVLNVSETLPEK